MKKPGLFSLLRKMVFREFKQNWAQFLAIVAIGGIAVTLFVGLLSNAQSFSNQVNEMYDKGNLADIWVTTSEHDEKDEGKIKEIVGDKGEVESRFYLPSQLVNHPVYACISPTTPTISKPANITAESPKNSDDYFVYVDDTIQASHGAVTSGFHLGEIAKLNIDVSSYLEDDYISLLDDYVKVGGSNIFYDDKISIDLEITAFMHHPENIEKSSYGASTILVSDKAFYEGMDKLLSENFTDDGRDIIYGFLYSALTWGRGGLNTPEVFATPNQYLIKANNPSDVESIQSSIEKYFSLKKHNNSILIANRSTMPFFATVNNDVNQAVSFTYVFPFVFFFVGVLVILTTISQLVVKERSQIGIMKAVGVSNASIYGYYIFLTLILVGLGIVIGEVVGPILLPFIMAHKYEIIYTLPVRKYVFPVIEGILTAVAFSLIATLVTISMCRKEIKLKPVESLRPVPPKFKTFIKNANDKEKSVRLSFKMAFRNIRKDVVKSLMVVFGVMGCTALLTCGFGVDDTVNFGVDHDMAMVNNWDVSATLSAGKKQSEIETDFLSIEGVKSLECFTQSMSTMYLDGGIQADSYCYIISGGADTHFKIDFDTDKVAISQKISRLTGAKEGDTLYFTVGNKTYDAEIGLVYDAFFYHGVVVHAESGLIGDPAKISYSGVWMDVENGADVVKIRDEITANCSYLQKAQTVRDWYDYLYSVLSGVTLMTMAVKVFAILLAVVVLYNLALMNFHDRTRDIATLKVLGFNRFEIALSLMLETMTLTAVGVAFGLVLGYPFLLAVLKTNIVELVEYMFDIKVLSYFLSFVLTFIVSFIVNIWLTSKTKTVKMVESLKSVE